MIHWMVVHGDEWACSPFLLQKETTSSCLEADNESCEPCFYNGQGLLFPPLDVMIQAILWSPPALRLCKGFPRLLRLHGNGTSFPPFLPVK